MTRRVTKSRSYSYKLFGVRHTTRYTHTSGGNHRSSGGGRSGPNVQVHLTGRDLLEMQRIRREDITAILLAGEEANTEAMANLSPFAVTLHTNRALAGGLLAVAVILAAVGAAGIPAYVILGALYFVDWHNLTTLHGKFNWQLFRYKQGSALYWTVVCLAALVCVIPVAIYLVQCLQLAPSVADQQRAKVQSDIARLEAELHPALPTATSSVDQLPS